MQHRQHLSTEQQVELHQKLSQWQYQQQLLQAQHQRQDRQHDLRRLQECQTQVQHIQHMQMQMAEQQHPQQHVFTTPCPCPCPCTCGACTCASLTPHGVASSMLPSTSTSTSTLPNSEVLPSLQDLHNMHPPDLSRMEEESRQLVESTRRLKS